MLRVAKWSVTRRIRSWLGQALIKGQKGTPTPGTIEHQRVGSTREGNKKQSSGDGRQ